MKPGPTQVKLAKAHKKSQKPKRKRDALTAFLQTLENFSPRFRPLNDAKTSRKISTKLSHRPFYHKSRAAPSPAERCSAPFLWNNFDRKDAKGDAEEGSYLFSTVISLLNQLVSIILIHLFGSANRCMQTSRREKPIEAFPYYN